MPLNKKAIQLCNLSAEKTPVYIQCFQALKKGINFTDTYSRKTQTIYQV